MTGLSLSLPEFHYTSVDNRTLRNYLFELTEQLRFLLMNIDEDNFTATYRQKAQNAAATAAKASREAETLSDVVRRQRRELLQNAETLESRLTSAFSAADGVVRSDVQNELLLKADDATIRALIASSATQTEDRIEFVFGQSAEAADAVGAQLASYIARTQTYQRFSEAGIEIGRLDSPFSVRIENARMSFLQNGVEVAYMTNSRLYIQTAQILSRLTLGATVSGSCEMSADENGFALRQYA